MNCRRCSRELASPILNKHTAIFCRICIEDAERITKALLYSTTSYAFSISQALRIENTDYITDAEFVTRLSDYAEKSQGHEILCEICTSKRKGKD